MRRLTDLLRAVEARVYLRRASFRIWLIAVFGSSLIAVALDAPQVVNVPAFLLLLLLFAGVLDRAPQAPPTSTRRDRPMRASSFVMGRCLPRFVLGFGAMAIAILVNGGIEIDSWRGGFFFVGLIGAVVVTIGGEATLLSALFPSGLNVVLLGILHVVGAVFLHAPSQIVGEPGLVVALIATAVFLPAAMESLAPGTLLVSGYSVGVLTVVLASFATTSRSIQSFRDAAEREPTRNGWDTAGPA